MGADQGLTWLFYDGGCGFCHSAVRFVARRDPSVGLRFAPLGGIAFHQRLSGHQQAELPDSLVVLTPKGELLVRSEAVIHLLKRMGLGPRLVATILAGMPRFLGDAVYRLVARLRPSRRACPMTGQGSDARFEP